MGSLKVRVGASCAVSREETLMLDARALAHVVYSVRNSICILYSRVRHRIYDADDDGDDDDDDVPGRPAWAPHTAPNPPPPEFEIPSPQAPKHNC